ncbi:2-oxoisovalerate dehydrogenase [Leptolyngbya sp. DQ-M1]|uniref:2-oxoisovalerate dehydrogenase n=1 Tax=Leptolyngbya sp. DQ-M1 TaxID=2933920 RepID=UPI0032984475
MTTEIVFLIEDAPEGGYTARALGESIFTEADDVARLREEIRDAVRCHFPDEQDRPKLIRLHFVRDEVIAS